jgi:hypothetical protein
MLRFLLLALMVISIGCNTITTSQKDQIMQWKAEGVYQEVKDPGTAAGLNLLIGIGDFYNGNIGYGIVNLLFWPLSILWAPIGGYDGALLVNYEHTAVYVAHQKRNETKQPVEVEKDKKK